MPTIRSISALALGIVLAIHTAPALAQNYPDRPIKIVNPFSPGGSSDTGFRFHACLIRFEIISELLTYRGLFGYG